jgi:alanine racemase
VKRAARAYIDLAALGHNLTQARRSAPHSRVVAMVKADAYGHGLLDAATYLAGRADALGVACIPEALALREAGIPGRILVTQGFKNEDELQAASSQELDVVVHEAHQLELLENATSRRLPGLWIKVDSGMHRLGFAPERVPQVHAALTKLSGLPGLPGFVTHFACADEPGHPLSATQLQRFDSAVAELEGEHSMANSAAVLSLPAAHRDWVRPGIMLYGSSPLLQTSAAELDLRPVMSLRAPLIAINRHRRGESVGYGATFTCPEDMPVGVVAIGYGDGYPRHAGTGTPVEVNGIRTALAGRVSMDMLAVDLRGVDARVGDEVELWGQGVAVDEVARHAQTIGYELLCNAGSQSPKVYLR